MLFKTVYGQELASIFFWIELYGPTNLINIIEAFGSISDSKSSSSESVQDAIEFLETTGIIGSENDLIFSNYHNLTLLTFNTTIIQLLRKIQINGNKIFLDPYFLKFIDQLYIQPDVVFLNNLHSRINRLEVPLPCSEEKVNAWKRVLEFLKIGSRGYQGLLVIYESSLILKIIEEWQEQEGPLQVFLEEHFDNYLPWRTNNGELAKSLAYTLAILEYKGEIKLLTKQDLPNKSFMGERNIKWISKAKGEDKIVKNTMS